MMQRRKKPSAKRDDSGGRGRPRDGGVHSTLSSGFSSTPLRYFFSLVIIIRHVLSSQRVEFHPCFGIALCSGDSGKGGIKREGRNSSGAVTPFSSFFGGGGFVEKGDTRPRPATCSEQGLRLFGQLQTGAGRGSEGQRD